MGPLTWLRRSMALMPFNHDMLTGFNFVSTKAGEITFNDNPFDGRWLLRHWTPQQYGQQMEQAAYHAESGTASSIGLPAGMSPIFSHVCSAEVVVVLA